MWKNKNILIITVSESDCSSLLYFCIALLRIKTRLWSTASERQWRLEIKKHKSIQHEVSSSVKTGSRHLDKPSHILSLENFCVCVLLRSLHCIIPTRLATTICRLSSTKYAFGLPGFTNNSFISAFKIQSPHNLSFVKTKTALVS